MPPAQALLDVLRGGVRARAVGAALDSCRRAAADAPASLGLLAPVATAVAHVPLPQTRAALPPWPDTAAATAAGAPVSAFASAHASEAEAYWAAAAAAAALADRVHFRWTLPGSVVDVLVTPRHGIQVTSTPHVDARTGTSSGGSGGGGGYVESLLHPVDARFETAADLEECLRALLKHAALGAALAPLRRSLLAVTCVAPHRAVLSVRGLPAGMATAAEGPLATVTVAAAPGANGRSDPKAVVVAFTSAAAHSACAAALPAGSQAAATDSATAGGPAVSFSAEQLPAFVEGLAAVFPAPPSILP